MKLYVDRHGKDLKAYYANGVNVESEVYTLPNYNFYNTCKVSSNMPDKMFKQLKKLGYLIIK